MESRSYKPQPFTDTNLKREHTQPFSDPEEAETDKSKQVQIEQTYKKH